MEVTAVQTLVFQLRLFYSSNLRLRLRWLQTYSSDKLYNRIMTDIIRLNFVPVAFVSDLSECNAVMHCILEDFNILS